MDRRPWFGFTSETAIQHAGNQLNQIDSSIACPILGVLLGSWTMPQTWGRLLRAAVGLFVILALFSPWGLAHGQSTDDSLRIYAVNIVRDPPQEWTGYGIYLGNGLVITAAHVVGRAARTKPSVRIAGIDLAATVIREGWFELQDLTLLLIDEQKLPPSLRMRRMPLCDNRHGSASR